MAYRIDYGEKAESPRIYPVRRAALTVLFFVLFLAEVYRHWPEGKWILQRLFSPEPWKITSDALETMASHLRAGQPFSQAVTAFCREIVQYGLEYAA